MAPPAALVIAVAAITAVLFQALLTYSPDAFSSSSAAPASSNGKLAELAATPTFASSQFTLATLAHAAQKTTIHIAHTSSSLALPTPFSSSPATHANSGGTVPAAKLVAHEARPAVPRGWAQTGPAPASTTLRMRLALPHKNLPGLERALHEVSDPASAKYGRHLSAAQVNRYMKPAPASIKAVTAWLTSHGVKANTLAGHGNWLGFSMDVGTASKMFGAQFATYSHGATGMQAVRAMAYSIPESLKPHIALAHPMTSFPNPYPQKASLASPIIANMFTTLQSRDRTDTNCSTVITPECLQDIYGIPATPATSSGNSILVTGYLNQFPQNADLASFLQSFRPDMNSSTTFNVSTIDNGADPQDPSLAGDEANLDIQYTVGVATGVPISFLSVGNDTEDGGLDGFLDTVNFAAAQDTVPTVMSTSYGADEDGLSPALSYQICAAFAALGARGVSILFASGDSGVGAQNGTDCGAQFVPKAFVGCPYVTAVGATGGVPETAASLSSGGFSNYFPTPDYQSSAVHGYLSTLTPDNYAALYVGASLFNASGRGFPDVAAYGQSVAIVTGGQVAPVDGTSCATPIFASVIALLNDRLIAAGRSPLGFLNPWLYANAHVLTDITDGSNPGCGTMGFPAAVGWDPVTGLGSPDFDSFLAALGLSS